MTALDFGIDLESCRANLQARQEKNFNEREMRRQAARQAVLKALEVVIPRYPQVRRVYLFGSVTRSGAFGSESDIDVAVAGTDAKAYFALWSDLREAALGWEIDLREINQPSYFTQTVVEHGEKVYEREDAPSEIGY